MENLDQTEYQLIHNNDIVDGYVVKVTDSEAWIDVSYRTEAILAKDDFSTTKVGPLTNYLKVGDMVRVQVIYVSDDYVRVSHKAIERQEAYEALIDKIENEKEIEVTFTEVVKGGIAAKDSLFYFMPLSQIDTKFVEDASAYLNKPMLVRVTEFNEEKRRLVVSRRSILEEEALKTKTEFLNTLSVGQVIKLPITEINNFGAVLFLNQLRFWLPKKEASHLFVKDLNETLSVGEEIEVEITEIDVKKANVVVSRRKVLPTPWQVASKEIKVDDIVSGMVTRIVDFGAFIELMPGVEGLLHRSELSYSPYVLLRNELHVGDAISVKIISMDDSGRKIGLSVKQMEKDPWQTIEESYKVGDIIPVTISRIAEFGTFVEVIKYVEALIPMSEYSYSRNNQNIVASELEIGKEVQVKIIKIDLKKKQMAVSIKQVSADPWIEVQEKYKVGQEIETVITRIEDYFAFAQITSDVEAMLFVRDETEKQARGSEVFQLNEPIKAIITEIDAVRQRFVISVKALVDKEARDEFESYLENRQQDGPVTLGDELSDIFAKLKDKVK